MYEIEKTERVKELIAVTKSDSGISGPELCAAHMELGRILADGLRELDPDDTTVVAMLRGGIFFAEGIYFALRCRFETFDPKTQEFVRPGTKNVIIVDSVSLLCHQREGCHEVRRQALYGPGVQELIRRCRCEETGCRTRARYDDAAVQPNLRI